MKVTNQELWEDILNFEFDLPMSEYGISTRLSDKQNWTVNFTNKAILEYRKFMFLATISDEILSPSEVVDEVWHTHLMFTKSYQKFCSILGKNIHHIPTTFLRKDKQKFDLAKIKTKELYELNFGNQPDAIWQNDTMLDSIGLKLTKINGNTLNLIYVFILFLIFIGGYFFLTPLIIQITNPLFLNGFISICIISLIVLHFFNDYFLKKMVGKLNQDSVIGYLSPFELVYLKNKNLENIVNGITNQLIIEKRLIVNSKIEKGTKINDVRMDTFQFQVYDFLYHSGKQNYKTALRLLILKPMFQSIARNMENLIDYVTQSQKFKMLFTINVLVLSTLFNFGLLRLLLGYQRNKPIEYLAIAIIVLIAVAIVFIQRLNFRLIANAVLDLYRLENNPTIDINDWQWKYFIYGEKIFDKSFLPLFKEVTGGNNVSESWSSCATGDSGGDSGGCSGCGGCGGD